MPHTMSIQLLLALGSGLLALALWRHDPTRLLPVALGALAVWQLHCALTVPRRVSPPVVLRLGGFSWDMFAFCRGWLITGQVGSGKTAAFAI